MTDLKLEIDILRGKRKICAKCLNAFAINPNGTLRKHNCVPVRGKRSNQIKRLMTLGVNK